MNHRRRRLHADTGEIIGTAFLACIIAGLLASTVGAATLLRSLQFGPPVGEMLLFRPYAQMAPEWRIDAVRSADHRRCILKPAIMSAEHGSVVVEQRQSNGPTFQVHWAGGPTSDGNGDCGGAVDLILGLTQMQTLVNADSTATHWRFAGF